MGQGDRRLNRPAHIVVYVSLTAARLFRVPRRDDSVLSTVQLRAHAWPKGCHIS